MAVTMIIIGTLTIAGLLAAGTYAIAAITGWKLTVQIWAFSAFVTALAAGAALLISYGVEHL